MHKIRTAMWLPLALLACLTLLSGCATTSIPESKMALIRSDYRQIIKMENDVGTYVSKLPMPKALEEEQDEGLELSAMFQRIMEDVFIADADNKVGWKSFSDAETIKNRRTVFLSLMKEEGVSVFIAEFNIYTKEEVAKLIEKDHLTPSKLLLFRWRVEGVSEYLFGKKR